MRYSVASLLFILSMTFPIFATQIYHCEINQEDQLKHCFEWEKSDLEPFTEMLISWNGQRPQKGRWVIYASVNSGEWSDMLNYAYWGAEGQGSYNSASVKKCTRSFQDAVELQDERVARGFKIRIEAEDGADLKDLYALHVCASNLNQISFQENLPLPKETIALRVPKISQMQVDHPRHRDLCSPTSTTATVRFLDPSIKIEIASFADQVRDMRFDIFGNWVLNVAGASSYLGSGWRCWVEKLDNFQQIYERLQSGTPVVVSVRSPLVGSAQFYKAGHLVVIRGYDAQSEEVLCMDPAFPQTEDCYVRYPLKDFIQAWERRQYVAYLFQRI